MDVTDFNINQEQKTFLLGDFNVDLIHYNEHKPTKWIFRFTCL